MTLGTRGDGKALVLGDHVGAGARLLGGIAIGGNAVIGANAVVVTDVPSGATAVGIPTRILTGGGRDAGTVLPPYPLGEREG